MTRGREAEEAKELFAAFVADRLADQGIPFEQWVRDHPNHEQELMRLRSDYLLVARELRRLTPSTRSRVFHGISSLGRSKTRQPTGEGVFRPGSILERA